MRELRQMIDWGAFGIVGEGVKINNFNLAMKEAAKGDVDGMYCVAVMFIQGLGVSADPVFSMHWFAELVRKKDTESIRIMKELEVDVAEFDDGGYSIGVYFTRQPTKNGFYLLGLEWIERSKEWASVNK